MTYEYICDICETVYKSASDYAHLKHSVCCDEEIWYSRPQIEQLKQYRPQQLKNDYAEYLKRYMEHLNNDNTI